MLHGGFRQATTIQETTIEPMETPSWRLPHAPPLMVEVVGKGNKKKIVVLAYSPSYKDFFSDFWRFLVFFWNFFEDQWVRERHHVGTLVCIASSTDHTVNRQAPITFGCFIARNLYLHVLLLWLKTMTNRIKTNAFFNGIDGIDVIGFI